MDCQKLQQLEKLCHYLSKNMISTVEVVSKNLNIPIHKLASLISELNNMGLDVLSDSKQIQLLNPIDIIDLEYIQKHLQADDTYKDFVYNFITESTNQLAQENKNDAIYISNYQSQGRGRQEKKWLTPLGQSIAISISQRFDFGLQKLSGLNIAIGVAIIQTLNQFGALNMGLKWPNDIINPKGKVAGILIEASGNNQSCRAIIGIGINWNIRQELFESIDQTCCNAGLNSITRSEFIVSLLININTNVEEFKHNKLQNLQSEWQINDAFINKKINVIQGKSIKPAIYQGINSNGLLNVVMENKLKTIASGEVSIRATN